MGDKNNIGRITCADVQLKVGHAILKAVYVSTSGDRVFEVIDGTADCAPTIMSIDLEAATRSPVLMPYINHPVNVGLRVQVVSGATGELVVVYE